MTSVTVERDGAVASVILPGPALSVAVKEGLLSSLRAVADDESVRAVVLTGTGRAFCVGQDLAEHAAALGQDPATALETVQEHYNPIVTMLTTMAKPVVAAVNGTCVGAGLGLVLACDFAVVAEGAVLGTAFTGIGLTCDSGLSVTLPAAVGLPRARALLLRPTTFTAEIVADFCGVYDIVAMLTARNRLQARRQVNMADSQFTEVGQHPLSRT